MTHSLSDHVQPPESCQECGATEDLVDGVRYEQDGDDAEVTVFATCRRCVRAGIRRDTAKRAAFWHAQVLAYPHPESRAEEHARNAAADLQRELAQWGVEPDEVTAAFIARYAT